jgi:hypothetical protein
MKRFKQLVRETAVEPDMPSAAARTYKEKPNKEPMAKLKEGRLSQRHPLEGHEYHKKSNETLVHIAKDAHKAAEAMKGHNTDAENKYRDQANDSATVRYFRQKNGMPDWYKKKYGHVKEENDTTEKVEMVQSQLHFIKYACEEILEYIDDGGGIEEWYQVKVAKAFSEFESLHAFIEGESRRTGMKEETEQLDELSKSTLGSYVKKASFSLGQKGIEVGQSDDKKKWKPITKKMNKRTDSIIKATDRLTKEETEQLDEISAETKSSYTQKATKQVVDLKPWTKKGEYKDIAKNIITRREKGIAMAKEEVEQIDELSNELLGRYKDKAADDAMKADKAGNFKRGDKRFSGVVKATNKQFANFRKKPFGEEVEELEEGTVKSQNKQKKNEYVSKIIQKKLHPSVLPSLEYGRRELKKEEVEELEEGENEQIKGGDPCWKGYEMVGMKKKNGKKVPNCVPTNEEKQEPPFDPDSPKKRQVVPGKLGAGYSTARHLARQALKKQAEKLKPVKESLEESRKTEIVKEIVKKKKNEKNDTETFQKEPVLSSEITKA